MAGALCILSRAVRAGDARVGVRKGAQDHRAQAHRRGPSPAHPRGGRAAGGDHVLYRAGGRVAGVDCGAAEARLSQVVQG